MYHVMARGVNRGIIFADDDDRRAFLQILRAVLADSGAAVIAYCLMTNHFHAAIKVGSTPLSMIMQRLLTAYATRFNRKQNREGHLFQARHEAKLITDEAYLRNVLCYIHHNPVEAGMVANAQDWPWSSAKDFGPEASADPGDFDPWAEPQLAAVLNRDEVQESESVAKLAARVFGTLGLEEAAVIGGPARGVVIDARKKIAKLGVERGHTMTEVAKYLHISLKSVSRYFDRKEQDVRRQA